MALKWKQTDAAKSSANGTAAVAVAPIEQWPPQWQRQHQQQKNASSPKQNPILFTSAAGERNQSVIMSCVKVLEVSRHEEHRSRG